MNPSYEMAGYFAETIQLTRTQKGFLEKIGFKIAALNLNNTENILSLKISVALEFDDLKDNHIDYMFGFILKDPALQQEILSAIQNKTLHDDLTINALVSSMSVHAYPFIRAHLFNLTLDSRHPIQLPLFDLSPLSLRSGIEFKQKKPDFSKIS